LQVKCAQRVSHGIPKAYDSMLQIATKQNDKNIALPENFWSSHSTGIARVIDEILLH